jgi:alpha-D-xyloside xylohydrolase
VNHAKTYDLPTFLNEPPAPVELVSELTHHETGPTWVELHCATLRYQPVMHNYYGTQVETVLEVPTPGTPAVIRLDFCTDSTVRLRYAPSSIPPDAPSAMLTGQFAGVSYRAEESDGAVTFHTGALRVEIVQEPFQIRIRNAQGKIVWETRALDIEGLRRPEFQWNPSQQRWIFYHRYAYPLGHIDYGGRQRAFFSLDLRYDEHLYGFGEDYGRLDKRNTFQTLWNQEAFGNASPAAYKKIPFYLSTRGYGLFLHTAHAIRVHAGDLEHTALSAIVDDITALDLFIIAGETFREILPGYTAITGAPTLPPQWTFGLWMARISYNRQAQVEEIAAQLRERAIPCDVIHIDTDWYKNDWECDLEFSQEKFPDPAGMMARLKEQGFRVSLWQWPNMVITSTMFAEAHAGGYLAKRTNGQPYLFTGFQPDAGFIDYSNPAAVEWIKGKFRKLFALGVAAIKVDFGEGPPPDAVYHNGGSAAMHNLYPLLYGGAIFDVTEETQGQGKAVIWARAAWAGSQRYPIHWSGDGIARYEDLAAVVRAMLSFGLSGFPFYSHDIGGFSGLPDATLYIRWAQLGFFTSHVRTHGTPPREPWEFGEQAESIFRRYAELRYRLLPYIYSEAVEATRASLPMAVPLLIDWSDDPTTYAIEDQYRFGRSLLVAPILDAGDSRRVYLPAGDWFDYWTKAHHTGERWLTVHAPLETLPLFVRGNHVLAYAPLAQHTDALTLDPLTLELYAPTTGTYTIHREDKPAIEVRWWRDEGSLHIEVQGAPGAVEVVVYTLDERKLTGRAAGDSNGLIRINLPA